jgi:uncharacterized protein YndB with AHSA1/START domain
MAQQTPLHFVFYFAAPPDKVWEGFVSSESNRIIFGGAELKVDLKPGGPMNWVGVGADGKRTTYVAARCSSLSRQRCCNTPLPSALPVSSPASR